MVDVFSSGRFAPDILSEDQIFRLQTRGAMPQFTLNTNDTRQNAYYLLLSIIACVIIFYFKNFSTALGATERIPLLLSVWSPIIILSLFCSIGIIQINEK